MTSSIPERDMPTGENSKKNWSDWRWQISYRFVTAEELRGAFSLKKDDIPWLQKCIGRFRTAITPFYTSVILESERGNILRNQVLPSERELDDSLLLSLDPLGEEKDSPVPGIVHRYPDRALLLITNRCAVYCRYCNRRRRGTGPEKDLTESQFGRCLKYLHGHPEIREVILSGGDPLTLNDEKLDDFIKRLKKINTVKILRIGSRVPVVLPYRITTDFCRILSKYQPIYLNIHINHPAEITPEMESACRQLSDSGIPLGSQTVLLKGINDDPLTLRELFLNLLTLRVKPYCLYHCDPVRGVQHFRTTIARGKTIMEALTTSISGMALPHYILDAPDGEGKIPIQNDYIENASGTDAILRSLKGNQIRYLDGVE